MRDGKGADNEGKSLIENGDCYLRHSGKLLEDFTQEND